MNAYAELQVSMLEGNSAKGIKHPVFDNVEEILMKIDQQADSGKDKDRDKENLVLAVYVLGTSYKNKLHMARSKNLRIYAKTAIANGNPKYGMDHSSKDKDKTMKVDKIQSIPQSIYNSKSRHLKLAIAIFLSTKLADNVKRDLVLAIVHNTTKTCGDIVELFANPNEQVANVRKFIQQEDHPTLMKPIERCILSALVELSELFKDKTYSKLGLDLNTQRYVEIARRYLRDKSISTIAPFEPVILLYVKHSIAQCAQEDERRVLYNQYRSSPLDTVNSIIGGLPNPKKRDISRVSDKSRVFNPDILYQCHKGPVGYTRDIVATYYKHGNKTYKILTYSDCLYDVIGCITIDIDQQGEIHRTDELFDRMSWIDRLKLLPDFRAKVAITTTSGAELNDYSGESCDITVSWFNRDGFSCSKTYIMKKSKDMKAIKVEDPDE